MTPDDVTDPLLWRLALDVIGAHQPDNRGDCRNLQCAGQRGMCDAARTARRAMGLARPARPAATPAPTPRAHGHAAVAAPASSVFRGWFTTSPARLPAPRSGGRLPGPASLPAAAA
ncbi:hypothetical protein ACGFIG_10435 [Micromonospora sp. NPDC049048]|uniref:hypothetical protein n=1 Tax=Micromonospora sp. NPDC049048 TaxID=3364263 RepID=UPI00371B9131